MDSEAKVSGLDHFFPCRKEMVLESGKFIGIGWKSSEFLFIMFSTKYELGSTATYFGIFGNNLKYLIEWEKFEL